MILSGIVDLGIEIALLSIGAGIPQFSELYRECQALVGTTLVLSPESKGLCGKLPIEPVRGT